MDLKTARLLSKIWSNILIKQEEFEIEPVSYRSLFCLVDINKGFSPILYPITMAHAMQDSVFWLTSRKHNIHDFSKDVTNKKCSKEMRHPVSLHS